MTEEKVSVSIRKDLYEKVKKFVEEEGGFSSVEEFIEYVVEQALELEESGLEFSEEDQEKISKRLKDLGYM